MKDDQLRRTCQQIRRAVGHTLTALPIKAAGQFGKSLRTVPSFSAPACSWAVEEQTQRCMYMGRASRHGQAMTDQPNQDRRRKKSPDHPTQLHSVDGSEATATDTPKDVPADPGTSNDTDDLSRKVMSPKTENCMK
jgi:hypothetical protein